jgi:hypothetical protein
MSERFSQAGVCTELLQALDLAFCSSEMFGKSLLRFVVFCGLSVQGNVSWFSAL